MALSHPETVAHDQLSPFQHLFSRLVFLERQRITLAMRNHSLSCLFPLEQTDFFLSPLPLDSPRNSTALGRSTTLQELTQKTTGLSFKHAHINKFPSGM